MTGTRHNMPKIFTMTVLALALAACGGGSGGTASSSLTGSLIDGPIQGAQVFVDLNNDQTRSEDEPISSITDAEGHFIIDVSGLTSEELAAATLVSIVPDTAYDADDAVEGIPVTLADAGRAGFTLVSPLSAYITDAGQNGADDTVVSPVTTLVAGAIFDDGLKLAEARERIHGELGLDDDQDPMEHYVRAGHSDMRNKARAAADAMGEARKALRQSLENSNETMSDADEMSTVIGAVRDQMTKAMSHAPTREAIINQVTKLTPQQVKDLFDQAGNDSDVANAVNALPETLEEAITRRGNGKRHRADTQAQTYIVIFKTDAVAKNQVAESANALTSAHGGSSVKAFTNVFQGFSVTIPAAASEAFLNAIYQNPNVRSVEAEQTLRRRATRAKIGTYADDSDFNLWNLDIADGTADGYYTFTETGAGTTAFVIDTGILASHNEFTTSRVGTGYNALTGTSDASDDQGHGTHVAGTVGGNTFGVSSGATLVPVKVLAADGSGTLTSVISGMDWVAGQVANSMADSDPSNDLLGHAVVNMSLGGGASSALDYAAANLVSQGIPVVVAAGNSNADACNYSPAREPSVITVGAAAFDGSSAYTRAYYSNFGSCVDVFAPGSVINSAGLLFNGDGSVNTTASNTAMATMSGTSMAAPHITGWVAQLLDMAVAKNATIASSSDVNAWITSGSTLNLLTDAGTGSPNLFMKVSSTLPTTSTGDGSGSVESPAAVDVHVADIQGRSGKAGKGWAAQATVTIVNSSAVAVSGAIVQGQFTISGSNYSVQCTTADNGSCTVGTSALPASITSVSYAPVDITPDTSFTYIAGDNSVSSVTISAPASKSGGGTSTREGKPGHVKR